MRFNRRMQLFTLIFLSAGTAAMQYVLQGAFASAHQASVFPEWFWVADWVLWGLRALIEAMVIMFLFVTRARTKGQEALLVFFEAALIATIALTIGPVFRSLGYGQPMVDVLGEPWYTAWCYLAATYTPLMIGATGFAYRVQPDDGNPDIVRLEEELALALLDGQALQANLSEALGKLAGVETTVTALQAEREAYRDWRLLPVKERVKLVVERSNGDLPSQNELAAVFDTTQGTISRWMKEGR